MTSELWAAVVGAAATIIGVWLAVFLGLRKLADTEMKRLRIKCVTEMIALRFVIAGTSDPGARVGFFSALNAVPGLFGDDARVMRLLRDFRETSRGEAKDKALLDLIRATAETSGVPLSAVQTWI